MAFGAVDERFIENFQHIAFDLRESKTANMIDDSADERFTLGIGDDPIEKIAFDRAVDPCRCERFAGEKALRIVFAQTEEQRARYIWRR